MILSNIDYFNKPDIIGTKERLGNHEFLDYIVSSVFRDYIADYCKGKEILKTLEELKQKIKRQQLTVKDRANFKLLNQEGFRRILTMNNSQGADPLPFVQQLNDELCDVEQLIKQYDSVPHVSKQNPVCQVDFVAPDKIDKKCSAKIFKLLQDKGYITDQSCLILHLII